MESKTFRTHHCSKPFITSEEQDFITELSVDIPEPSSYLNDDALFWDNLDDESYHNLQNAMEG